LHAKPQVLPVQTATAFGSEGAAHVMQPPAVPHWSVLSSGKQPLVAGHVCVPAPQFGPQVAVTQAWPSGHGSQSTPSMVPHVVEALLLTRTPLHRWNPVSQWGTQVDVAPVQVTVPLLGATQA